jgi:hypothetical protein
MSFDLIFGNFFFICIIVQLLGMEVILDGIDNECLLC